MPRRSRRPFTLALVVVAYVVVCPLVAFRLVAGPPRYRACVAALEQVAAGMPWSEAEAHLAAAIASGAVAYSNRGDPPWTPGQSARVKLDPPAPDIEEVVVLCWRFNPDGSNALGRILHEVWQVLVAAEPRLISRLAFTPIDYVQLLATRTAGTVSATSLYDCVTFGHDNSGPADPPFGCRHHSAGRR